MKYTTNIVPMQFSLTVAGSEEVSLIVSVNFISPYGISSLEAKQMEQDISKAIKGSLTRIKEQRYGDQCESGFVVAASPTTKRSSRS